MPDEDRSTEDLPRPLVPMLSYAKPSTTRDTSIKHAMAILFAVIAISLGVLFAIDAIAFFTRSLHETTTRESRLFRQEAMQMFACSVVLIVPGLWYGRLGIRGERDRTC